MLLHDKLKPYRPAISEKYGVEFILSVSEDKENLPANAQECTVIAL